MRILKWAAYTVVGFVALIVISAILFPPDPKAAEQRRACQAIAATVDSGIWSPVACDLDRYKAMLKSPCSQVYTTLFDRLACFVPVKSEYVKKKEEDDAIAAKGEADIERDKKQLEEVMQKIRAAPAKQNLP